MKLFRVGNGAVLVRTIAVEFEDPARIAAALQALNIEGLDNVNYPRGLKRLVKMPD